MLNYDKDKMHSNIYLQCPLPLQCFFGSLLHFYNTLSVIVQCFRISESWFDSSGLITRMIGEDTIIKARKRKSLSGRRYWRNFKIFTQAHSLGLSGSYFCSGVSQSLFKFCPQWNNLQWNPKRPQFFYCEHQYMQQRISIAYWVGWPTIDE